MLAGNIVAVYSTNIKTDGGYTTSYIRQASPAKDEAPIKIFDVSLGGKVKGSHPILLFIQLNVCNRVDMNSDIYITMLVPCRKYYIGDSYLRTYDTLST